MTEPDWDKIAKLEKAIMEKYGERAIINPKSLWNEEKEKEYLNQIKALSNQSFDEYNLVEGGGFLLSNKLFTSDINRICVSCNKYCLNKGDNLYLSKFRCCFNCYVQYVEDREQKWFEKLKHLEGKEQSG